MDTHGKAPCGCCDKIKLSEEPRTTEAVTLWIQFGEQVTRCRECRLFIAIAYALGLLLDNAASWKVLESRMSSSGHNAFPEESVSWGFCHFSPSLEVTVLALATEAEVC